MTGEDRRLKESKEYGKKENEEMNKTPDKRGIVDADSRIDKFSKEEQRRQKSDLDDWRNKKHN